MPYFRNTNLSIFYHVYSCFNLYCFPPTMGQFVPKKYFWSLNTELRSFDIDTLMSINFLLSTIFAKSYKFCYVMLHFKFSQNVTDCTFDFIFVLLVVKECFVSLPGI